MAAVSYDVRPAARRDLAHLALVEGEADGLFAEIFAGLDWDPPRSGAERVADPGFLLVVGDPPVGFAQVLELEGRAHLEQLAVRPSHMRRGVGGALVEAAKTEAAARGHQVLSLCTYADVSWNAPWYARHGFIEVSEPDAFHRRLREHEEAAGLDRHGRRVVMTAEVTDG